MRQEGETGNMTTLNACWTEASLSSYIEGEKAWRPYFQQRGGKNKESGKEGKTFSLVSKW